MGSHCIIFDTFSSSMVLLFFSLFRRPQDEVWLLGQDLKEKKANLMEVLQVGDLAEK